MARATVNSGRGADRAAPSREGACIREARKGGAVCQMLCAVVISIEM